MTRAERQLAYVGVLIDLTGLDRDELAARPPEEQFLVLLKAVEERGVTLADVQGWMAQCDPEGTEPPPGVDPVACFRDKAATAMAEPPLLSQTVLLWGAVGVGAAIIASRVFHR